MSTEVCNRISDVPDRFIGGAGIAPRQHSRFEFDGIESSTSNGFEQILVATDFSAPAAKAVQLAAALAAKCQASLTVLHVVDTNPDTASSHAGGADALMSELWQNAVIKMAHLKDELSEQNIPIDTLIVEGLPWEQIAMHSRGFDLLVLGRTPPRPSWNFFPKRTGKRALDGVACPVLSA